MTRPFRRDMGTIHSSSTKISKMEVYIGPGEEDQTILYSTTQSRICALRAVFGVQTAYFRLRDDTLTSLGFRVEIKVCHEGSNMSIDFRTKGDVLDILYEPNNLCIQYGIPNNNFGIIVAKKYPRSTGGETLFVFHVLSMSASESCVGGWRVWHDVWRDCFMSESIGPFLCSSFSEIMINLKNSGLPISSNAANSTSGDQTSIIGLINNLGGPVFGNLNGAVINNSFNNYF